MLTKITRVGEVESVPLTCDPALRPAQVAAALALPADDPRTEAARLQLERAGVAEPPPAQVAGVVADAILGDFWFTSDEGGLLDVPESVARAHLRALSRDEARAAERAAGPPPRRGRRVFGRVTTQALERTQAAELEHHAAKARAEAAGEPMPSPPSTFGEHRDDLVDDLPDRDARALHDFELWTGARDHALAALALDRLTVGSPSGIDADVDPDLVRGPDGFPVDLLVRSLSEGAAVVAEVAQHVRNLTRLGKGAKPC